MIVKRETQTMANLQLKSVSKIYPSGTLALYKVNLELKSGEFVAVVGGEKSGKRTLLRMVAGLEEVTCLFYTTPSPRD